VHCYRHADRRVGSSARRATPPRPARYRAGHRPDDPDCAGAEQPGKPALAVMTGDVVPGGMGLGIRE